MISFAVLVFPKVYIYLRYLPLIFQFAWLSAYHLKEHTYTLHIPTWWLELAFSITQPNFMAASYSRKCLVSRQLLYFEEIKVFPLSMETTYWRIWRDGQASLKGMLNMCTYFVLIEYVFSLKGIYIITFEQTYSSAKLFQGEKKDFGVPKFQWGYYFLNKMLVQVCAQSPSQRSEFFGAILIIWCMSANHNTGTNQTILFHRSDIFLNKLLWGGKMRWKRNFKKWYIA